MTGLQVWLHPSSRTVKPSFPFPASDVAYFQAHPKPETSNASSFRRTAPIVWNRREVLDRPHFDSGRSQRANRRLAARTRPAHAHIHRADTVIARHVRGVRRRLLRGERRSLARPAEAERSRALPGNDVPRHIRDRHDGVVERSLHVHESVRDVLALFLLEGLLLALFIR